MSTLLAGIRLMPFAVDAWAPDAIRVERQTRGGLEIVCQFPCVAIDLASRTPLRLNNTRYDLDGMPDLTDSDGSEAIFIRDLVKRQCKPWDPQAHRLVDRYFEVLESLLAEHAKALDEQLAEFGGLFAAKDWLFSAPRPFPRAHLFAPEDHVAPRLSAEDFVMVDFAFFLGPTIVALLPSQSGMTPKKARDRADRLARAGVRVETYTASDIAGGARDFFCRALGPRLPAFWEGDPLPAGPFRPMSLEE